MGVGIPEDWGRFLRSGNRDTSPWDSITLDRDDMMGGELRDGSGPLGNTGFVGALFS
jgi:hypothetical protein